LIERDERFPLSIVWLRRDLRLSDNVALYEAARVSERICAAFVINPPLLASERMGAPLVCVFFDALAALRAGLRDRGSDLALLSGDFADELQRLAKRIGARAVFYNEDYEPSATRRDRAVTRALTDAGLTVRSFVDHVYFGAGEVRTNDGAPYRVFTPYKRRWLEQRACARRVPAPSERALDGKLIPKAAIGETEPVPEPADYGFTSSTRYPRASESIAKKALTAFLDGPVERYEHDRDFPAIRGTSQLSPQLRAGTIGIRTCIERAFARRKAHSGAERSSIDAWISELIWRDFYQMILSDFPSVARSPFIEAAAAIEWRSSGRDFAAWCAGETGYPIVDAAMRQLNAFGWMHNRLRMIAASFLSKHLLIDWRKGERYFERHLADADLAQNNGGWQWAASTGTDAVPYFRIFNPVVQSERFDPDGTFIKHMLPELANVPPAFIHAPWNMPPLLQATAGVEIGKDYPAPIVDHMGARERALAAYGKAFGSTRAVRSRQ
jgi:deoxyribodipyrimidine photo-lyase